MNEPLDEARRRLHMGLAIGSAAFGVLALSAHGSGSQPGQLGTTQLLVIGFVAYFLPFTAVVYLVANRYDAGSAIVGPVSAASTLFLATRPPTAFVHAWYAFALITGTVTIVVCVQVAHRIRHRHVRSEHSRAESTPS